MGLPKDEGGGQPISEFVALRSKSYCVKFSEWDAEAKFPETDKIKKQRAKVVRKHDEIEKHLAERELQKMLDKHRDDVKKRNKGTKKHKGVKKCVVKNFTMDTYRDCLDSGNNGPDCKMSTLQSKLHEIKTVTFTKKGLSVFDDKRYYTDNINSLAHGHKDIINGQH